MRRLSADADFAGAFDYVAVFAAGDVFLQEEEHFVHLLAGGHFGFGEVFYQSRVFAYYSGGVEVHYVVDRVAEDEDVFAGVLYEAFSRYSL